MARKKGKKTGLASLRRRPTRKTKMMADETRLNLFSSMRLFSIIPVSAVFQQLKLAAEGVRPGHFTPLGLAASSPPTVRGGRGISPRLSPGKAIDPFLKEL